MAWTPANKPSHPSGEGKKPTSHEVLADATVAGLSLWFEAELERLEKKFADFKTKNSVRKSLGR